MSDLTIKRLYTENPFVDSLLYYSKLLAYNTVIKLDKEANNAETVESIKRSDLYIISYEGRGEYDLYTYTEDILKLSSVPAIDITAWANDNSKIPSKYHDELTKIAQKYYIDNYIEENNYYRMITGKPNLNDYGIPIKNYEYLIPEGNDYGTATYIHELSTSAAQMLETYGVLDVIKADYPNARYLDYITCGISIYKARKAYNYQILYQPSLGIVNIEEKFTTKYNNNRLIVIRTMYSEAMKLHSSYYDNFMAIMIMLMTMSDMLTEVQEHLIKKDILDIRCVQLLFEQYGVPYYHSIPLTFQIKMVKQINTLIRYKSCAQGMFNLIEILGGTDINIYKYFLLRDRKRDTWGDYVYNLTQNLTSIENEVVEHVEYDKDITDNIIPFPFDYILEKGNVLFVSLDGYRLVNGIDYQIYNYNHIKFLNNITAGHSKIQYSFYYDKNTMNTEFIPDTTNAVTMVTETIVPAGNSIDFSLPYNDYFNNGNQIILSVGGVLINPNLYNIDKANNKIIADSSYSFADRECIVIYLWGTKMKTAFVKTDAEATETSQTIFNIPEPFKNYTLNGNGFFITIGSTFIDSRRYTITDEAKIVFKDTSILKGRHVTFNFIYSMASVYSSVDITKKTIGIMATEHYQTEFKFDFPIENYIKYGYRVYVKLRGWYLSSTYYDIYRGKLVLRNQAISLQPKEIIYLTFVYGPTEQNILVNHYSEEAKNNFQDTYDITYPVDKFFAKGNKLIVDSNGYLLNEGIEYHLSDDKSKVIIDDQDVLPYKGDTVNYTFVYNAESEYAIELKQEILTAESDGQNTFYLTYPFYPYLQTTQGLLIFYKSLLVNPKLISFNKYNVTIDMPEIKKGEQLSVLYIFNNKYLTNKLDILTVKEVTVDTASTMDTNYIIPIPTPFEDYIEHSWPYFVEDKRNLLSSSIYEVINNGLVFLKATDLKNNPSLTFVFVYKDTEPYLNISESEDYDEDIDLKFVRVALKSEHPINELKSMEHFKSYDAVTLADKFWDGEENDDSYHETLKKIIKKRAFNYARTKYMTIEYTVEITDMAFEIAYFYNMLYDDVFREDLLLITVPSINPNAQFKLANLFIYMTALAYNFSGYEDKILSTPTQVLYCKGFNFKANLAELKQYIKDNRRLWTDYDVFGFLIPEEQIPDMNTFVNIYRNNKKVYRTIIHGMAEAPNHDIYSIWKKMYDSLMIWKLNMTFFKLSNGAIATTFSDFLKDKDPVLYKSLTDIKNIADRDTREDTIVTTISNIVYILEEWLPSKEFKYIYSQFPGVSQEYILQYLFTMINFFKSYKIILNEMNVEFRADDPDENMMRFQDVQHMLVHLKKPDYAKFKDTTKSLVETKRIDSIGFIDKVIFQRSTRADITCTLKVE